MAVDAPRQMLQLWKNGRRAAHARSRGRSSASRAVTRMHAVPSRSHRRRRAQARVRPRAARRSWRARPTGRLTADDLGEHARIEQLSESEASFACATSIGRLSDSIRHGCDSILASASPRRAELLHERPASPSTSSPATSTRAPRPARRRRHTPCAWRATKRATLRRPCTAGSTSSSPPTPRSWSTTQILGKPATPPMPHGCCDCCPAPTHEVLTRWWCSPGDRERSAVERRAFDSRR